MTKSISATAITRAAPGCVSNGAESALVKVTTKDFTALCGFQKRWIYELIDRGFIPKPEDGVFLLGAAIQGVIRFYQNKDEPARERLTKAQASREERKDRMESGEDIHSELVRQGWENVTLLFRQRMLCVGNNVQSKCGVTELIRAAIEREIADGLRELDKKIHYAAELNDDAETLAALKPE